MGVRTAPRTPRRPEQAVAEAKKAELRPLYLLSGEERFLSSLVFTELRRAVLGGVDLGLNEDQFDAGEVDAEAVIAAARTLPMMASRRLVVVRNVERWEPKTESKPDAKGRGAALDRMAE